MVRHQSCTSEVEGSIPAEVQSNQNLSVTAKNRILELSGVGYSHNQISQRLSIPVGTVSTTIRRHKKSNSLESQSNHIPSQPIAGRPAKISESSGQAIINFVENKNTATLREIKGHLNRTSGVNVSESTISRFLNRQKISLKRTTLVPQERNNSRTKELRYNYVTNYMRILRSNPSLKMVYLDESGFNLHLVRTRGRARPGITPTARAPASYGRNMSLLQAISVDNVLYYELCLGSVNAITFRRFLEELQNRLPPNSLIVMDNARIHHSLIVTEWLTSNGLEVLYLPPYSPFLNPIENTFAQIKNVVRSRQSRNADELKHNIEEGIRSISATNLANYYRRIEKYIDKCLTREDINN